MRGVALGSFILLLAETQYDIPEEYYLGNIVGKDEIFISISPFSNAFHCIQRMNLVVCPDFQIHTTIPSTKLLAFFARLHCNFKTPGELSIDALHSIRKCVFYPIIVRNILRNTRRVVLKMVSLSREVSFRGVKTSN